MVDHLLKFDLHIDHIIAKVCKRIGALYRSKSLLPLKYRKMFANSLMLPQFDYLDIIYSKAGKTKLFELGYEMAAFTYKKTTPYGNIHA